MKRLQKLYRRLSRLGVPTEETLLLPALIIVVLLRQAERGRFDGETVALIAVVVCAVAGFWLGSLTARVGPVRALLRSWALGVLVAAGYAALTDEVMSKREYINLAVQFGISLGFIYYSAWFLANTARNLVLGWPATEQKRLLALKRQNVFRRMFGIKPKETLFFSRMPVQSSVSPTLTKPHGVSEALGAQKLPSAINEEIKPTADAEPKPMVRKHPIAVAFAVAQGRVKREGQHSTTVLLADGFRLLGKSTPFLLGFILMAVYAWWSGIGVFELLQGLISARMPRSAL